MTDPPRQRIDRALVARGLFESRAQAQAAIAAGRVFADGVPVRRPAATIAVDARIEAQASHPWVSRGGEKLAHALDAFAIDPTGVDGLDVGASTGGFTDVLLARGARRVVAVDVGHGQLHPRLAADRRVTAHEGLDARALTADIVGTPGLIVIDVSFIPLAPVLAAVLPLAQPGTHLVALIKPQFEAGPKAGKKGIVRDPAIHAAVCDGVADVVRAQSWTVLGIVPSPITGGDGNREFLLGARR